MLPSTRKQLKVECEDRDCPHFDTCCQICTEYYSENDRVDLLIFGQGAGKVEEATGRPFVGPAGKRMRQIISYIWQTYDFSVAFSNNVRCHPTDSNGKDRAPTTEEVEKCSKYLRRDIDILDPVIVVPVGMSAYGTFFDATNTTMARVHGNTYQCQLWVRDNYLPFSARNQIFVPTYHPSYVIRRHGQGSWDPSNLTETDTIVIQDLCKALTEAGVISSEIHEG